MAIKITTLLKKIQLTDDIFELHYKLPEISTLLAGQFITFILPGVGGRSYSVLEIREDIAILIIKKWPTESGGRGGSIMLCDANIGDQYKYVGPVGHFVLTDKNVSRLFIGTGTGLVPLYSHIIEGLAKNTGEKYQLVFGVRYVKDLFYLDIFEELKKKYQDTFYYHLVVSRGESQGMIHSGYVTDFLSQKVVSDFEEYYLCGAPAMIEGVENILENLGVKKENIYFEKYA